MPEHPESEAIAELFREMQCAAEELSGAAYQNAPDILARYVSHLREEPLATLLTKRLPEVDFTTWYETAVNSRGGVIGSGKRRWCMARGFAT